MAIKKNLSASSEDYLEAIYNLICRHKVARSKDIAESLGVSRASVTGALKSLNSKGLVDYKPYGFIGLTEKGTQQAESVVRRHNIIESFFVNVLGVEQRAAKQAACKAEHALGPYVISRLLSFTEFSTSYSKKGADITAEFNKYCRSKGV
ncbi:MAG: metal-dependent transcriptional regulator [Planctomycetes bacterium]|nr:metal-dependent transcriptional regulator [Planctomycetota bacterium]MBU1518504.1 metal-dependent transcriptional regulator [Planctomycetota bacterium]MBU2457966.1 metal-dependent transcriptional regulator [Planctomycetota bacterium]